MPGARPASIGAALDNIAQTRSIELSQNLPPLVAKCFYRFLHHFISV
jgi:hypothetical protein